MKIISMGIPAFAESIPNGREYLTEQKNNIIVIMNEVIKNKVNNEFIDENLVDDIAFIEMVKKQIASFNITDYDVRLKDDYFTTSVERGLDLVVMNCVQNENEKDGKLVLSYKEFLNCGQVLDITPGYSYAPKKETEEYVRELSLIASKEIRLNCLKGCPPYPDIHVG